MVKKIALVTCYFQPNYGSQLQAFATQEVFKKLGLEHETIMIDGLLPEINKAKYRYFSIEYLISIQSRTKWRLYVSLLPKGENQNMQLT